MKWISFRDESQAVFSLFSFLYKISEVSSNTPPTGFHIPPEFRTEPNHLIIEIVFVLLFLSLGFPSSLLTHGICEKQWIFWSRRLMIDYIHSVRLLKRLVRLRGWDLSQIRAGQMICMSMVRYSGKGLWGLDRWDG